MTRTDIAFPYGFDARGRTATAGYDDHVRQLIEQLLLTAPGERVNRPTLGGGLLQLVFAPNSPERAAALELALSAALTTWLGDVVELRSVVAESFDSTLRVTIAYAVLPTSQEQTTVVEVAT